MLCVVFVLFCFVLLLLLFVCFFNCSMPAPEFCQVNGTSPEKYLKLLLCNTPLQAALENGGFFFTTEPHRRGKSSYFLENDYGDLSFL